MKRIFSLLLALCMLAAAACAESAPAESAVTPLLYEISDDSGNSIWLFGSIHAGEEHFYPLPDYVYDAYQAADALAVEFDILSYSEDQDALLATMQDMFYTDGTTIADHVPAELYEKAVQIMTDAGQYNPALDYCNVTLWWSMLDEIMLGQSDADMTLGVDMHMLETAHADSKPVIDIESADFQFDLINSFPEELQLLLLESSIESFSAPELVSEMFNVMLDSWAAGDAQALRECLDASEDVSLMSDEERALYEAFDEAMTGDRDDSMTDFAENALKNGERLFICVGAAHVVGEDAMVDQLTGRGYHVAVLGGNPD